MKRKGNINVISDRDIIVTGAANLGNNLDTVVEKMSEDIHDLKSQLKWTHKYGAVGNGSGGGGTANKWSVSATLDSVPINNGNTISLNGAGTYELKIAISGASSTYYVTYTYGGISKTATLSADNQWKIITYLDLKTNGNISIEASDNIEIKNYYASYITTPYAFDEEISLCNNTGAKYSESIFILTAEKNGLKAQVKYNISIKADCSYKWTFNGEQSSEFKLNSTSGIIEYEIPKSFIIGENAGVHSISLEINLTPEGQDATIIKLSKQFSLIPDTAYLQVLPVVGQIYNAEIDNAYQFRVGDNISFRCKAYFGTNQYRTCNISWNTNAGETGSKSVIEQSEEIVSVLFSTKGWSTVTFNLVIENEFYSVTKYVYCEEIDDNYTWFIGERSIVNSLYYKGYEHQNRSHGLIENIDTQYINVSRANTQAIQLSASDHPDDYGSILINIGIQYSKTNNTSDPICNIYSTSSSEVGGFINIYQNKVIFNIINNTSTALFLHKEIDYDPLDFDKYHLITIALNPVKIVDNQKSYEYCVYIDGVLESALTDWYPAARTIKTISFEPGNYAVNHVSVDYFSGEVGLLNDTDINYFYYSYKFKSTNGSFVPDEKDINVLNKLYDSETNKPLWELKNNLLKVPDGIYNSIANDVSIPTLVLTTSNKLNTATETSIYDWLNGSYSQDSSDELANMHVPVDVKWSKGSVMPQDVHIGHDNFRFFIELQGSSTMGNKAKNLNLGIETTDSGETSSILFSPNYVKSDYSTFLPETQFTLKADVVDSAHSNNVAMGRFVNENNNFQWLEGVSSKDPDILKHVRKCLDGIPVLVYLEVENAEYGRIDDTYFLGVYLLNLGRESYFNLAYRDLNVLSNSEISEAGDTTFAFVKIENTELKLLDNVIAAEVQGNSKYWDFSQWHETILFEQDDKSSEYMLGDLVYSSNNSTAKNKIQNFVKKIAKGGGYLFGLINKKFLPVMDPDNKESNARAYHIENTVPDYKSQYKRNNKDYSLTGEVVSEADLSSLIECLGSLDDDSQVDGVLNYDSLVYYYTTCMTFGLVDSVQKNLNIKTWNNSKFGTFFYDMDTCLGRDNAGNSVSHFAFSDFWKSNITEISDTKANNNAITILRDYFPERSDSVIGYDIPSSYLFAIAKYSAADPNCSSKLQNYPQQIYANWRRKGGVLETAKTFINKYYAPILDNVPECLINLNYRNKYLYYNESSSAFGSAAKNLFGIGVESTTEWLNNRLHILDAYFNLSRDSVQIYDNIYEAAPTDDIRSNSDVLILRDIFQGDSDQHVQRTSYPIKFTVSAPAYSPLMINYAGTIRRYILEDPNIQYVIEAPTSGTQTTLYGGSQLWTKLDSIDSFTSSSSDGSVFNMNNDYIEEVYGPTGSYSGKLSLNIKSARLISLTSNKYTGTIELDKSFLNLYEVNVSNSKISAKINEVESLAIVNANDVTSSELAITNCNNLSNVFLRNAKIDTLTISPVWGRDINLSETRVVNISLTARAGDNAAFSCNNRESLLTATLNNFDRISIAACDKLNKLVISNTVEGCTPSHVYISNCGSLTSIEINVDKLEYLNISGCTSLVEITLRGSNFDKLTTLDISRTRVTNIIYDDKSLNDKDTLYLKPFVNLSHFNIANNDDIETIQFANVKNSPIPIENQFSGCKNLKRIYGNVIINTAGCFNGLNSFSIHGINLSRLTYGGISVYEKNKILHPKELYGDDVYFYEDDYRTNLTFGIDDINNSFADTSCTVFDFYYVFWNLGAATKCKNLFQNLHNVNSRFNWQEGNNISPYLFEKSGEVTTLISCFRNVGTFGFDSNLFKPLENCTSIKDIFTGSIYICYYDSLKYLKKVFNIDSFSPAYIIKDSAGWLDLNYKDVIELCEDKGRIGDLSKLFKSEDNTDLPISGSVVNLLNGTSYINYDNNFKLPKDVTGVYGCFVSNSAHCENFIIKDFFVNPKNIIAISNSFKVIGECSVEMPLTNSTFEEFINIETIGTLYNGIGGEGDARFGSFYNFKKTMPNGFPSTIFNKNTKLVRAQAIFSYATSVNNIAISLPGDMFINNPNLSDVSALFYNIQIPYTLSDNTYNNFKNCKDLSLLDYTFANDLEDSRGQTKPSLSGGNIPYQFLKHGDPVTKKKVIYGKDNIGDDYTELTVSYKEYSGTIKSMKYCFMHADFNPYINSNPEYEDNPNYSPFKYISADGVSPAAENPNIDKYQYTYEWSFDGANKLSEDYKIIDPYCFDNQWIIATANSGHDENITKDRGASDNYIAPPDLLRYCTIDCDITGLFAYCGVKNWGDGASYPIYDFGVRGRICPYMLKPLGNTRSVKDLFRCCKLISYWVNNGSEENTAHVIPNGFFNYAPYVSDLSYMFEDAILPQTMNFSGVFTPLQDTLKITGIFQNCYWMEREYKSRTISAAFKNCQYIDNMYRAFFIWDGINTTARIRSQSVKFSDMFDSGKYNDATIYTNKSNYHDVFRGYTSIEDRFTDKTLVDNTTTNNYTTY